MLTNVAVPYSTRFPFVRQPCKRNYIRNGGRAVLCNLSEFNVCEPFWLADHSLTTSTCVCVCAKWLHLAPFAAPRFIFNCFPNNVHPLNWYRVLRCGGAKEKRPWLIYIYYYSDSRCVDLEFVGDEFTFIWMDGGHQIWYTQNVGWTNAAVYYFIILHYIILCRAIIMISKKEKNQWNKMLHHSFLCVCQKAADFLVVFRFMIRVYYCRLFLMILIFIAYLKINSVFRVFCTFVSEQKLDQ